MENERQGQESRLEQLGNRIKHTRKEKIRHVCEIAKNVPRVGIEVGLTVGTALGGVVAIGAGLGAGGAYLCGYPETARASGLVALGGLVVGVLSTCSLVAYSIMITIGPIYENDTELALDEIARERRRYNKK